MTQDITPAWLTTVLRPAGELDGAAHISRLTIASAALSCSGA